MVEESRKEYYLKNSSKVKEKSKEYYQKNKEKIIDKKKKNRQSRIQNDDRTKTIASFKNNMDVYQPMGWEK